MAPGWRVEERRGDAAGLHTSWRGIDRFSGQRGVALCLVTAPSLVLGSTQPLETVDRRRAARRGVSIARRRSGGGAVLVRPGDPVWIDLWVPVDDPLWSDDVARAFDWVGATWVAALERLGLADLAAHRSGSLDCTSWSKLACFGGIGRGEVFEGNRRKVVGIAQRRTRAGAWFHCACALRWEARPLVDLLALTPAERESAIRDLDDAAVGAADLATAANAGSIDAAGVTAALIDSLPARSAP